MTTTQTANRGRLIETFNFRVPSHWRPAAERIAQEIEDDLSEAHRLVYEAGLRALENGRETTENEEG